MVFMTDSNILQAEPRFCRANVAFRWEAPEYTKRIQVGDAECGHPEGRHRYGICYDCDELDEVAGMHHEFIAGGAYKPIPKSKIDRARERFSEAIMALAPSVKHDDGVAFTMTTAKLIEHVYVTHEALLDALREESK